jgi:Flp pilus assembly pilin Flp
VTKLAGVFLNSHSGATSIEYAMIASFIGLAIIAILAGVGTQVSSVFVDAESGLKKRPAV